MPTPLAARVRKMLGSVRQAEQQVQAGGQGADADVETGQRVAAAAIVAPHPANMSVVLAAGDEVRPRARWPSRSCFARH